MDVNEGKRSIFYYIIVCSLLKYHYCITITNNTILIYRIGVYSFYDVVFYYYYYYIYSSVSLTPYCITRVVLPHGYFDHVITLSVL